MEKYISMVLENLKKLKCKYMCVQSKNLNKDCSNLLLFHNHHCTTCHNQQSKLTKYLLRDAKMISEKAGF